jgi:Uncharacterized enzyme involved in pigment biosynthesis
MLMRISEEVKKAIENGQPVVALESTIISHGMPYPQNVETAMKVERIIREGGAIPATIGIIDGVGVVGMSPDEIEQFGSRKGIAKVSRRDLPVILAQKMWGATTVATTMIFAAKAGIEVFVTGGIGGVHRGAAESFDISADLQELANTNVTVICAGAKAILDLPLTLEYLETFGVPVLGYQTEDLAAFYSMSSGLKLDAAINTPEEIADIIHAKREFGLDGGMVISNPIPQEYALDNSYIDAYIEKALKDMKQQGVHGKDSTPFLLAAIKEATEGKSLVANIELVYNNARLGAKVAKSLAERR